MTVSILPMSIFILLAFFVLLIIIELLYFKIANKYNIIDKPNHRSSHTRVTIRGGGIIFSLTLLIGCFYTGGHYAYFLTGLFLISLISFIDDIKTINNRIRIIFHLLAVALLFLQLNMYSLPITLILLAFVFAIGSINAINFMDGINGITGGFGLVTMLTLYYINSFVTLFTDGRYIILVLLSLLVFNFFNFRTRAKCFAGDVGSVSLAFIIVFFVLQLMLKTNNINYLLLMLIYGSDTVITIAFRIIRKENVFEAHRTHFYQFLANKRNIPHLGVTIIYTLTQLLVNIFLVVYLPLSVAALIISLISSALIFIAIRIYFEGYSHLIGVK